MRTINRLSAALFAVTLIAPTLGHALRAPVQRNPTTPRAAYSAFSESGFISADSVATQANESLSPLLWTNVADTLNGKAARLMARTGSDIDLSQQTARFSQSTKRLAVAMGATDVMWNLTTNVPLRIWGAGTPTPGVMRDAAAAQASARAFLQAQLAIFAPGAAMSDFVLLTNEINAAGDLRSVSFAQQHQGVKVLGAAIHVAFKADRLVMAGSTAYPNIVLSQPTVTLPATQWLRNETGASVSVSSTAATVVLPLIVPSDRNNPAQPAQIRYFLADQLRAKAATAAGGDWDLWTVPTTGAAIARRSRLMIAQGIVSYKIPNRSPQFGEIEIPAALATHRVNGSSITADQSGSLTWPDAATSLIPGFAGPRVKVDSSTSQLPSGPLTLVPNGTSVLTSTKDTDLAAMTAYVSVNITKQFVKQNLDPNNRYIDAIIPVTVNEDFECNAYSSGDDIHFATKSSDCINTGLLSDVIHHEFGHSLHSNSLTPGVGQFDGSASEGLSDVLALSITEDPVMGAGFFNAFPSVPVRDLDPDYGDKKYPDDATGEVHDEGELIAESLWDTRRALISALGREAGVARANKIFYAVLQRSTGITTGYPEALLADDDDGNISNGTPNQCLIKAAFGRHGLADGQISLPTVAPSRDGFTVSATLTPAAPAIANCAAATLVGGTVNWHLKHDPSVKGSVPLVAAGTTATAVIPTQPDGSVVQYKLAADLSDGSTATFPVNIADQEYEFYVGPADPLWCAEFDAAGDKGGMTTTADWEVGVATAGGIRAGDATAPFTGAGMLGTVLGADGNYRSGTKSKATLPVVDLAKYSRVRLQFMRWISVNDAEGDQATVAVAGATKWTNPKRKMPTNDIESYASRSIVLQDKEWRFVDVDLGDPASGLATNTIDFTLTSNGQDERGGWNLDHLCVVGTQGIVGDGQVVAGEECDDGNTVSGDGCSDQGKIEPPKDEGGCCSAQGQSIGSVAGSGAMALLVAMGIVRRRRRT